MSGPLALVGGGEFLPAARPVDEWLLRRARSRTVTMLPTAAAHQRPDRAVATARRHFDSLDATVVEVPVLERDDAHDESLARRAGEADVLYLCGGDPRHLLEVLSGSPVWQSILDAYGGGAVLAGSSAGAMVLCQLGLVERVLVIPHYERPAGATRPEGGERVLGIEESTALILDGERCHILGRGSVTLYAGGREVWTRTAPSEMEGCL